MMNVYPSRAPWDHSYLPARRQSIRKGVSSTTATTALMLFIIGILTGYFLGLLHQAGQKAQHIEDEKILAAGCRADRIPLREKREVTR